MMPPRNKKDRRLENRDTAEKDPNAVVEYNAA